MQYFPGEGRFDKMYFPYYGKKAHVSIYPQSAHVHLCLQRDALLTDGCLLPVAGQLLAAPGGCEAAAQQGGLQQGASSGVQGRGL